LKVSRRVTYHGQPLTKRQRFALMTARRRSACCAQRRTERFGNSARRISHCLSVKSVGWFDCSVRDIGTTPFVPSPETEALRTVFPSFENSNGRPRLRPRTCRDRTLSAKRNTQLLVEVRGDARGLGPREGPTRVGRTNPISRNLSLSRRNSSQDASADRSLPDS
jgi:hypothetical protein